MKKRWILVPILVVVLILGITGGAAGVALAQGDGTSEGSPWSSFTSRVAAILGLDEAKVQDAFDQAARDMQDEALRKRLDNQVEQGQLSQEQADDHYEWYQSRPEGLSPGFPFGGFGGRLFHRGGMWGGPGERGMWFNYRVPATPTPES